MAASNDEILKTRTPFRKLSAKLRHLAAGRVQTSSEILIREDRNCGYWEKAALLSGCVLGFIVACSTPVHNYQSEVTPFSTPTLGREMTAHLGEHMLDQGIAVKKDVLYINKKSRIALWSVKPGKFDKIGVDDKFEYYDESIGERVLIHDILGGKYPEASLRINLVGQQVCVLHPHEIDTCGKADFTRRTEDSIDGRSFRRTLIYSGRVGDKLRITYREFSNNVARGAFSNDVEYDLNESSIIGYAGAQLEIIEATNIQIRYKVIAHFD